MYSTGGRPTPPDDDSDKNGPDQEGANPDGDPVQRTAGREPPLGGEPETELESNAQDRGRKFNQQEHPPREMHQATDCNADRSRSWNEPGDEQYPRAMTVVERLDLENAFRMRLLPEPVRTDQPTTKLPADQEPDRVAAGHAKVRGENGPEHRKLTGRNLPAGGNHDQILGEMETHAGDHQQPKNRDRTVKVKEVLNEMICGFVHGNRAQYPRFSLDLLGIEAVFDRDRKNGSSVPELCDFHPV